MKFKLSRQTPLPDFNQDVVTTENQTLKIPGAPQNHACRHSQRGNFHTGKRDDEPRPGHCKTSSNNRRKRRQGTKNEHQQA